MKSDRVLGAGFLLLSLLFFATAMNYSASFSDPLGPAKYPMLLAGLLFVLAVFIILWPTKVSSVQTDAFGAPVARQTMFVAAFAFFGIFNGLLGVPICLFVIVLVLSKLFMAPTRAAFGAAVVIAGSIYVIFDSLLGLPLQLLPVL